MKITEQDFLNIINRNHICKGREITNGKAKEGHDKCNGCHGNYFVGGECNFGGCHTVENDLNIINQNFERFDLLLEQQNKISKAVSEKDFNKSKTQLINDYQYLIRKCEDDKLDYFNGTCILLDGKQDAFLERAKKYFRLLVAKIKRYIEEVRELDWWKLKNYKDKLDKLEKMNKEANQLASDYQKAKQRGDEVEANRLMGLLLTKQSEISSLKEELKNDPLNILFGDDTRDFFANIGVNLFRNNTDFLKFKEREREREEEQGKFLGFIPKKYVGKLKWGGIILVIGLLLWWIIWWIIRKFK
jgi:hypothetical protein